MGYLNKVRQAAMAIALIGASVGAAHATVPGENGVIVYADSSGRLMKRAGDGTGNPALLADAGSKPEVSPNGKQVAYTNGSHLYVINIDGSNVRDIGSGTASTWSPDGKKLAITLGNDGQVYVADTNTWQRTPLGTFGSVVHRMDWPDLGDWIAVSTASKGYLVNAVDGRVLNLNVDLVQTSWFPTGGDVVGVLSSKGCTYSMRVDGGNLQQLACGTNWPSISPDGLSLLAQDVAENVTIRSLSGGNVKSLGLGSYPTWSRIPKTVMLTTPLVGTPVWAKPTPLASDADTYMSQSAIAVTPRSGFYTTHKQVLGIGTDGRVYHRVQWVDDTWSPWNLAPGIGGSGAGMRAKHVAIASALDGSAQMIVVGADNLVYHAMRYPSGTWAGFNPLDGYGGGGNFAARDAAIAIAGSTSSSPGQAQVVANGLDAGFVYHRLRYTDGNWTPWGALEGAVGQTGAVAIATVANGNGDAYVLATSPTQGIMRQLRHADGTWDGWVQMSNVPSGGVQDVSLALNGGINGVPAVAWVTYVGPDGRSWSQRRPDADKQISWLDTSITPLFVMPNSRSVSISPNSISFVELIVVQTQAQ